MYTLLLSQAIRKYLDDLRVEVEQLEVAWKRRDYFLELHIGGAIGLSNCYHWTVFLDEQFESTMSISACWKANRFDFPTQLGMYRAALSLIDFLSFALSWESVNEWRILAGGILPSRGNLNPPQIIWISDAFGAWWNISINFTLIYWGVWTRLR